MNFSINFPLFCSLFSHSNLPNGMIVLYLLSLEIFTGYRILIWQGFFLSTLQILNCLGFIVAFGKSTALMFLCNLSSLLTFHISLCLWFFCCFVMCLVVNFLLILLFVGFWNVIVFDCFWEILTCCN